jgi:uncharacterized membrane protein YecN with MAPEG domain
MQIALAGTFVALLSLVTAGLAFNVSVGRFRGRIPHGEGPNRELARAIRAHMNSVEHLVPIGLLLLAYALLAGSPTVITALGSIALLARIALSIGILRKGAFRLRQLGAFATYAIEAALGPLVLVAALSRLGA